MIKKMKRKRMKGKVFIPESEFLLQALLPSNASTLAMYGVPIYYSHHRPCYLTIS
jgi:hypothetical protein